MQVLQGLKKQDTWNTESESIWTAAHNRGQQEENGMNGKWIQTQLETKLKLQAAEQAAQDTPLQNTWLVPPKCH